MGRRGPPKTPLKVLEDRGSWKAKINKNPIQIKDGKPVKPDWLGEYADAAWDQTCGFLEQMGILASIDNDALLNYCVTWERWRKAEEFLKENGSTYTTVDKLGNKIHREYPESKLSLSLAAQLLRLQNNFGLTPSARASITLPEKPKDKDEGSAKYLNVG